MTAGGTALALDLIVAELGRVPAEDREEVAAGILGSLSGRFMLIQHQTAEEETTTRAELAGLGIPGLFVKGATS